MAAVFSRFSSLGTSQFRAVWFGQRIAELRDDLEASRDLVQWQYLSLVVMLTTIVYLLARGIDSLWVFALIVPVVAIGGTSLRRVLILYRLHVHAFVMPAFCEAFGRLRYVVGEAPDLCCRQLAKAGLLPRHDWHRIDDVFFGEYRGRQLTLALASLWRRADEASRSDQAEFCGSFIVMTIQWPAKPARLPADELSGIIDGQDHMRLLWSDGALMLAIPCSANPFDLGGLFEPAERLACRLEQVAAIIQMPPNLIDHLLDQDGAAGDTAQSGARSAGVQGVADGLDQSSPCSRS